MSQLLWIAARQESEFSPKLDATTATFAFSEPVLYILPETTIDPIEMDPSNAL